MVLVDTSIWISHLRDNNPQLQSLLNKTNVLCHPLIIGELACGNLQNRDEVLSLLNSLPQSLSIEHEEILHFIESHDLMGKGLGYVDMCLLASGILTNVPIWTLDKKLSLAASLFNLCYTTK